MAHTEVPNSGDHHDPVHDIEERKTVVWLFAWGIALIAGIWVMTQLFYYLVFNERADKMSFEDKFTIELRQQEVDELNGKDGHKDIEKAVQEDPSQVTCLRKTVLTTGLALALSMGVGAQGIGGGLQVEDAATRIDEQLGKQVPLNLTFRDSNDQVVKLSDYVNGERAVILNVVYFRCPGLCGAVTNAMVQALKGIDADDSLGNIAPGRDVELITVTFDAKEFDRKDLAEAKKVGYLRAYGKPEASRHWHFLRGDEKNTDALTEAVGFNFRWNQTISDFDHRAVLILLSPSGKVTRYLYGAYYEPRTLRLAVVEASEGKVGTTLEKILLSCYGYDPSQGTYSKIGVGAMTIGGVLTLLGLGVLFFVLWRNSRRHAQEHETVPVTP